MTANWVNKLREWAGEAVTRFGRVKFAEYGERPADEAAGATREFGQPIRRSPRSYGGPTRKQRFAACSLAAYSSRNEPRGRDGERA